MDTKPIIDSLVKTAWAKSDKPEPEDYTDPNTGLKICGKCHTEKTFRFSLHGKSYTVPVMCRCQMEKAQKEADRERERERQRRARVRRDECFGVGSSYAKCTFDAADSRDPRLIAIAKGYVKKFGEMSKNGKGLLLMGPPGTGKTYIACCIANALIDAGRSVKMTLISELLLRLQSTWSKAEIFDSLLDCELLIIDDLGAERRSETSGELVHMLINSRCASQRPMIVTSNIRASDFLNGDRIYSRLYEACYPVTVGGEDRRLKAMMQDSTKSIDFLIKSSMSDD